MGHSGFESREKGQLRYRERKRKKGLCMVCSNKAEHNKLKCKLCLKKDSERNRGVKLTTQ